MKHERTKGFITGILISALAFSLIGTAAATIAQRTMTADYNDIKISVNGTPITPTDAKGNPVEPFAVDGTTYLPVRAVGDALGMDVAWDGKTSTVTLNSPSTALDTATVQYAWLITNYSLTLHSLCKNAAINVENGSGSATEIESISDSFYDDCVPELETLRKKITNDQMYSFYMAAYEQTGAAEEAIYRFSEHEANPSSSKKSEFNNALKIEQGSHFDLLELVGDYLMQ